MHPSTHVIEDATIGPGPFPYPGKVGARVRADRAAAIHAPAAAAWASGVLGNHPRPP